MSGTFPGAGGVDKLLRIAEADADALRVDLADIERARASAEAALDEIAADGADPDETADRRFNLRRTLASLDAAAEAMRARLDDALADRAKLERLVALNRRDGPARSRPSAARRNGEVA